MCLQSYNKTSHVGYYLANMINVNILDNQWVWFIISKTYESLAMSYTKMCSVSFLER